MKLLKKTLVAILAAGLAGGAFAQTKLKWAHAYETSEPFHKWSVWVAQEFGKRTNGKYQIDVYPAAQLGKESDSMQGLSLGTVDIVISGASFSARAYPRIGITYYPFIFRDVEHLLKYARSDVYRDIAKGYADKTGNQVIATTYYGARHTTSNKPITKCSDLKGLKMRVPDAPAYVAMPRACGANTSPIAFAEVYLALQNGTVEAQENPLPSIEAKKFYEVQKNIAMTGHILDAVNTIVSGKTWKQFNDAEKKLFTELAQEGAQKGSEDIERREKELVDIFKQKGLAINEVDRNDFRNTVLQKVKFEDFGYLKSDYDRIQAVK
jgi:tripartite ATP-independent transporter DctP family solute receptor